MQSQADLGRSFQNGATSGKASSVEIRETNGGHALVDTRGRKAVLAYRYPSGHVVAFEGWYGHSPSTSSMMTKLGISPTCRHDDDRTYRANATSAEAPCIGRTGTWGRGGADCSLSEWLDTNDPTFIGTPATA